MPKPSWDRARLRRVEVDADRVHGQVGETLLEQPVRAAEGHPERELRPASELLERCGEPVQAAVLGARQERLLEHDQVGVERVDLRLEDAFGQRGRLDAGAVGERERRRQRHEPRAGQRGDVAAVQRLGQLRSLAGGARSTVERVRVQEAGERALLQPVRRLDDRPEDVLPAEHPVREQVEPRGLLDGDELAEIALDQLVDRLRARAPAIEVARRLDELLRARIDPRREGL